MFQDLAKRPAAIASAGAIITCLWLLVTNWDPIRHGHPTYLVYYLGLMAIAGLIALRWLRNPERTSRLWLSIIGALAIIGLTILAIWIRPFGAADVAVDAMEGSDTVTVTQSGSRILMEPTDAAPSTGLIFYPGARVDARAYANILTPIAEAGYQVVIVKPPFGIAFFSTSFAEGWIADHPEIDRWAVAGHSLGGVVAATSTDRAPLDGLVFWASFPASDISSTAPSTSSIFGTNDGLTTVERIDASRADLPSDTLFVAVEGGVHSDFGDYGLQPGDGRPTITRPEAQAIIVEGTLALLSAIGP